MKTVLKFCLVWSMFLFTAHVHAQTSIIPVKIDTASFYKIELKDGSVFIGKITSLDQKKLTLKTELISGVEINLDVIKKFDAVQITISEKGQFWFSNPNRTRYLLGNTAFTLRKGEVDYQNIYLSINSFNFGVSDNFSVGGGFELISTFTSLSDGDFSPIFFLNSKLGFKSNEKLRFSAGALYIRVPSDGDFNGLFIPNGTMTIGDENSNVSGSMGLVFGGESTEPNALFSFSGIKRISKRVAFISENWFNLGEDSGVFVTYGLRFMGEKVSVDLAFINNKDIVSEIPIGIPYLDFVVKF